MTLPSNEWISDYYLYHLVPTLKDLGASEPEISRLLSWFREVATEWTGFSTMADFAKYARARLRIKLGQAKTNVRSLAMKIIDALFGDEDNLTLQQVIDAVAMLVPAQPLPFETRTNGDTMLVDLGDTSILKCDKQFFEQVLVPLYPFEVRGTKKFKLVKAIPMGENAEREVDLFDLACWHRFPNATKLQRKKCALHSADELDWSRTNLYSRLEEGVLHDKYQQRVDPVPEKDHGQLIACLTTFDPETRRSVPNVNADKTIHAPVNRYQVDWDFDRTPSDFATESA
jgi:hypothetical protein